MFVNQTGLGQFVVPRLPRGVKAIAIPPRFLRRGMGDCCVAGGDAACPCPSGLVGGSWLGQCAACLDPNNLPAGCTSATDPLQIACQPSLHGSYQITPGNPCASGYPGWVEGSDGTWTWCGSGPAPAYNPSDTPTSTAAATPVTYPAPAQSGAVTMASLVNTTRGGSNFQVGDSWKLTINGAPNSAVSDTATQNGTSLGTTPSGATDANGNFSLTGTMGTGQIGNWTEQWSVGGVSAPMISFSVSAAPASGSSNSGSSSTSSGTSNTSSTTTAATSTSTAACFAPLAQFGIPDPCLGPIGLGTLAAGVVGLIIISSIFGGRR